MVKSFKIKPENKLTDDMKKFRMYNWWNSYEYRELNISSDRFADDRSQKYCLKEGAEK